MDWRKVKISSFLKERTDRFHPEDANKTGLHRIEKIDFSGKIYINDNKPTKTDMILVKRGDLVISGINVEKGAVSVYQGEKDVLATIHYSSYQFDENQIDIGYFTWFLKSKAFIDAVNSQNRGGIKTELKAKKFLALEIDLPDIDAQREIRNKLNSVSNEINEVSDIADKNEKLIEKLRQEILSDAVSGKLVPQDPNDEPASILLQKIKTEKEKLIKEKKIQRPKENDKIFDFEKDKFIMPNNWILSKFVNLFFVTKLAGFEYTKYIKLQDTGEVQVVRAQNVKPNRIDEKEIKYISLETSKFLERSALVSPSLLITFIGAGIGEVAIFDKKERWHLAPNVAKAEAFGGYNYLSLKYTLYFLMSEKGQREIFKHQKAGAQPSLSMGAIRDIVMPLPPLKEQKRIAEKVDKLMAFCDELEKEVKNSQLNSTKLLNSVLREVFEAENGDT